jgi:hypothetical protein
VPYLRIEGKGGKVRYVEAATEALRLITAYLEAAGHDKDLDGPLFRPVKNNLTKPWSNPSTRPPSTGMAKSVSIVVTARPSLRQASAMLEALDPLRAWSCTVVASWSAVHNNSAISTGRFSSTLNRIGPR